MSKSTFDQRKQNVDQQQNADHIYNVSSLEKDPFEREEIIHNATGAAKALYTLGMFGAFGGFLVFFGGVLTGATGIAFLAFGVVAVGAICSGIGYSMARSQAYKRRVKSRQK